MLPTATRTITRSGSSLVICLPLDWVRAQRSNQVKLLYGRAVLVYAAEDEAILPQLLDELSSAASKLTQDNQPVQERNRLDRQPDQQ